MSVCECVCVCVCVCVCREGWDLETTVHNMSTM